MRKDILTQKEVNEVLSRAEYWSEVVKRRESVRDILRGELSEVVQSLGLSVLWILKEYAKEIEETKKD